MSRPDPSIVFHCQLSQVTGDQQTLVISFNGSDQSEMWKRLQQATEVMGRQVKRHNDKVQEVTAEIRANAEKAKRDIIRADRRLLADAGLIPRALLDVDFEADPIASRDGEEMPPPCPTCGYEGGSVIQHEHRREANGGADPAGKTHLRPDS